MKNKKEKKNYDFKTYLLPLFYDDIKLPERNLFC
jgi:hypothetical protein